MKKSFFPVALFGLAAASWAAIGLNSSPTFSTAETSTPEVNATAEVVFSGEFTQEEESQKKQSEIAEEIANMFEPKKGGASKEAASSEAASKEAASKEAASKEAASGSKVASNEAASTNEGAAPTPVPPSSPGTLVVPKLPSQQAASQLAESKSAVPEAKSVEPKAAEAKTAEAKTAEANTNSSSEAAEGKANLAQETPGPVEDEGDGEVEEVEAQVDSGNAASDAVAKNGEAVVDANAESKPVENCQACQPNPSAMGQSVVMQRPMPFGRRIGPSFGFPITSANSATPVFVNPGCKHGCGSRKYSQFRDSGRSAYWQWADYTDSRGRGLSNTYWNGDGAYGTPRWRH